MKRKHVILDYLDNGARYTLLFMVLYLLVAVFEGSCARPVLNSAFLFVTAPFNPLENCIKVLYPKL